MASPPSATMVEKNEAALPAARPYSSLPSPLDSETPDVASLFPTAMTGKRPSPYGQDSQVRQRRKRAFKKAPGAPKRAKSAYILFSQESRSSIKEKLGASAKVTDVMRGIADAWKELASEDRAKWEAESDKDKERYRKELETYKGPLKVANKRDNKKPADAPKRAMSAFLLFSRVKRKEIRAQHPEKKNVEISSMLGELWRELPGEEKEPFQKQAREDGAKYKAFMDKFYRRGDDGPDQDDDEEAAADAHDVIEDEEEEEEEEDGERAGNGAAEEEEEEEEGPIRGGEEEEEEEEEEDDEIIMAEDDETEDEQ